MSEIKEVSFANSSPRKLAFYLQKLTELNIHPDKKTGIIRLHKGKKHKAHHKHEIHIKEEIKAPEETTEETTKPTEEIPYYAKAKEDIAIDILILEQKIEELKETEKYSPPKIKLLEEKLKQLKKRID